MLFLLLQVLIIFICNTTETQALTIQPLFYRATAQPPKALDLATAQTLTLITTLTQTQALAIALCKL